MGWDCLDYKSYWLRDHWPTVLSVEPMVCLSVVRRPSVTFCIVAKRCVLAKKCLKE